MFAPGTALGPYVIDTCIGTGGMGEVYRARDTRLDRAVAIKVVKTAFGGDPQMRRRFDEERHLAARLDHPRIGAVYDAGHDAGVDYLVLEFLEGQSLADRIARGPIPVRELIGHAIEIASGLAFAHSRGVVHRDLKPANVLITQSGIKIIDFGIGKLRHDHQPPSSQVASLKTKPQTGPTAIPGTTHYMSPERLNGQEADARADVFAFGAVLYEMATGRRPFDGDTPASVIAAILTSEPPPLDARLPAGGALEWAIARCLRKNPDERWQSMADVETVLKRIAATMAQPDSADQAGTARVRRISIRAAAAAAVLALATAVLIARAIPIDRRAPDRMIVLSISPPEGGRFTPTESSVQSPQLAVSPNGRHLAFVAAGPDGVPQLWIRSIDSTLERPLPGTAHAMYPFWSPDSDSIGFFAESKLKRVDVDRGGVRSLADARNGRGGTWNRDGVILFSPGTAEGLFSVGSDGGVVQRTTLSNQRRETSHRWPQFLPDGRRFLFFARSDESRSGLYVGALDGSPPAFIAATNYGGVFAAPGRLLYVLDSALVVADFDAARGRLTGAPVPVVDRVATSSNFYGAFSASANGVLAYARSTATSELVWFGRDGRRVGVAAPQSAYADFRLSPSGRQLAIAEVEPHTQMTDLRLLDLVRGSNSRLTTSPANDASPVWSPDEMRLVFRSNPRSVHDLFVREANGGGDDELLLKTGEAKYPTDWTRDLVVYHTADPRRRFDLWAVPMDDPAHPRPLVRSEFDEIQGQVSPDGRWLAYTSNMAGRLDVYVQSLSEKGPRWPVSAGGGSDPRWRRDGRELYYIAPDRMLMAVEIEPNSTFDPGPPHPLFRVSEVSLEPPYLSVYNVDPTGERFLVRVPIGSLETLPLTMLVNWSPAAPMPR